MDSSSLEIKVKQQIRHIQSQIDEDQINQIKIEQKREKQAFHSEFIKSDVIMDVMCKDKEFNVLMKQANP